MGDGGTINGIDENNTVIDRDGLMRIHMPGYFNSISKGVASIMVSYSSWNGEKMHANQIVTLTTACLGSSASESACVDPGAGS